MNADRIFILLVLGVFLVGSGANPALADLANIETTENIATETSVSGGYRGISINGNPGRALEYGSLKSSPLFKTRIFTDQAPYHFDLGVDFLNENDFSAEAHLDTKGLLRLDLSTERFFHNLDHLPYDPAAAGSRQDADYPTSSTPSYLAPDFLVPAGIKNPAPRATYADQDASARYGLRLDVSEAELKIRVPDYPAHLNLSYWRFEKEGESQLRYAAVDCGGCHMQSRTRKIDRVTEEVKASVDAHVGFVDVVLETLLRTFRDREPIPVDNFSLYHPSYLGGDFEHDEDPDSTLKELTIRANTAPSGGLVASASFTLGERKNRSDLTSVAPVKAETDYYKTAADVTYTPNQRWTFNLRYRLFDMDSDNSTEITDIGANAFPDQTTVRDSIDITRAWYETVANYRPTTYLTLKAELRREEIDRSNNTNWELPDEEIITRVKLGFSSRLLEKTALKLSGWLAIQQNDEPAYGTSFSKSQELFFATSYTPSPLWGFMANATLLKQENTDHEIVGFDLDREKQQQSFNLGTWVNPRAGLGFDLNYGYFHTAIDQDLLFGTSVGYQIPDDNVEYRQTVQTVTVGMTWQALQNLSCRLEGYHIRSKAAFSPDFATSTYGYFHRVGTDIYYFPGTASSTDLKEISQFDIRQNGVRGRMNWQINNQWSCAMEASFDDYDERGNDVFDGSVQSCMVSFSRKW